MRRLLHKISVGCCLLALSGSPSRGVLAQAPLTAAKEQQSLGDVWFEGTVGDATIRAYVGDAGWPKPNGLWGIYYYTKYWTPLPLDGDWIAPGRIGLVEGDPDSEAPKPRFDLNLSRSGAVGTWISADRKRTLRVSLRRVPKPAAFKVAISQARRFADPRWPITLSYPAGWKLEVTQSDLKLRSPDPEDMLFDNELSCARGNGLPARPGPGKPPVPFKWPFFVGPSGWLVETGSDECTTDTCEVPATRESEGATFVRHDIGYRMYGPWGYMGAADKAIHLIVVGQAWVLCDDRLLDVDTRIGVAPGRDPRR